MPNWFEANHFLLIMLLMGTTATAVFLMMLRKLLRISSIVTILIAVLFTVTGVISVRVFARLEGAQAGAMSIYGAVFFIPAILLIMAKLTKRSQAMVCDIFTPCTVFTLILARFNCLKSGCCLGKIINPAAKLPARWPTREAEIVFYIVLLIVLIPKILSVYEVDRIGRIEVKLKRTSILSGAFYPIYMMAYGAFRFFIEWFREGKGRSAFHLSHIWSLLAFGIGLLFFYQLKVEERIKDKNRKKRQSGKK